MCIRDRQRGAVSKASIGDHADRSACGVHTRLTCRSSPQLPTAGCTYDSALLSTSSSLSPGIDPIPAHTPQTKQKRQRSSSSETLLQHTNMSDASRCCASHGVAFHTWRELHKPVVGRAEMDDRDTAANGRRELGEAVLGEVEGGHGVEAADVLGQRQHLVALHVELRQLVHAPDVG
eukprot:1460138-Rhodomonas_salina.6